METKPTFKDFMLYWIAAGLIAGIVGFFWAVSFLPHQNDDSVKMVLPVMTGSLGTILGYLYGSSSSAKQKDATIENLSNNPPVAPVVTPPVTTPPNP